MREAVAQRNAALEHFELLRKRLPHRVAEPLQHPLHALICQPVFQLRLVVNQQQIPSAAGAHDLKAHVPRRKRSAVFTQTLWQVGI